MLRPNRSAPPADDYGLLAAAATVPDPITARTVRDLLRANGIRATTGPAGAPGPIGRKPWRVLVFPEDAVRAYEVLCSHTA
ncbi:DUF2007 domain-containing protein [Nocardia arthritidis]|uniref:DUF2007 domain-containing protein n=1 Tax=Nocardia arthritidis TaxID=228602 RepID=A0A6G9YCI1_9NOCA|nr:DUF2007 domain-containing protein [Nocardia arthritidis]QIS10878.1 hypothetical protein F5544_14970 [Nocardia arthritidis]